MIIGLVAYDQLYIALQKDNKHIIENTTLTPKNSVVIHKT